MGKVRRSKAREFAAEISTVIAEIEASGATSVNAIASALNLRSIPTPSGRGTWQAVQVQRLRARLA